MGLQQQHKSFIFVHNHLKKAKKRQARYANRNAKYTEFQIGAPLYVKKRQRSSKLEGKWLPNYRILEKRASVTYIIENTLDTSTEEVHAEHLHLANLEWEIPKGKNLPRKARYVINPEDSDDSSNDSEPDHRPPLHKIADKYHCGREGSSDEDDIPLIELAKRLRARQSNDPSQDSEEDKKMDIDLVYKKDKYKKHIKKILKSVVGIL